MTAFSIIFSFFVICITVIFERSRAKKVPIDAMSMSLIMLTFIYFIIPDLIFTTDICGDYECNVNNIILIKTISFVGVFFIIAGYIIGNHVTPIGVKPRKHPQKISTAALWMLVIVSIVSLAFYVNAFGGLKEALIIGPKMRFTKFDVELGQSVYGLYLVRLASIVLVVSQYYIYDSFGRNRRHLVLLIITSAIILFVYALILGSRGTIFQTILLALFIHINKNGWKSIIPYKPLRIAVVFFVITLGMFFVFYGKQVLHNVSNVTAGDGESVSDIIDKKEINRNKIFKRLVKEFSHPYVSIDFAIKEKYEYNYFKHFFYAPFHLIPSRIIGLSEKPPRISNFNSNLVLGDSSAGYPPGLFASFWYGGGLIGVILASLIYGMFISIFQKQLFSLTSLRSYYYVPLLLYVFWPIGKFVSNGDLSVYIKGYIHFPAAILLLIFFNLIVATLQRTLIPEKKM